MDAGGYRVAFCFFAVPAGYVFGLIPALFTSVAYCAALSLRSLAPSPTLRASLGAISGGVVGEVWFAAVVGPDAAGYGLVAALVAALLALCLPPAPTQEIVRDHLGTCLAAGPWTLVAFARVILSIAESDRARLTGKEAQV